MKLPFQKTPQTSSWTILFPLFSLLFHLGLFFFFIGTQVLQHSPEIKDEEIIAMVDLNDLPPQSKTPEPQPPVVSPAENPGSTRERPSENEPAPPEPILDPELDEALADEGDIDPVPIETAQNIVIPLPPPSIEAAPPETTQAEPEAEREAESVPGAEALVKAEPPSEEASNAESGPEPETSAAPEVAAPEPTPASPSTETSPSAQEVAKASEVQDPPKAKAPKEILAAIKKPVPSPPKPKLSKEKVKKSGLLGLLGNKKRKPLSKNPRFAKTLNRPKSRQLQVSPSDADTLPTASRLKMDQLKNKLLKSEQKRLMAKRSTRRTKKSQLKIVQGSGRNFGVISSAIAQEEWRLTRVYNRLLQRSPGLQGNLIIEFTISPEGKVIKSHILTSSFANASFEKALMQAIRLWKFPLAKEGETTILYPLAFSPAG